MHRLKDNMVIVAQLAEHRIVVPSVAGSSPVFHPKADSFESAFFLRTHDRASLQ